jgi:uncharacterized protein with ATP-grasp and redox domains
VNLSIECIPCIVSSFVKLLHIGILPEEDKEKALRRLLEFLSQVNYQQSPPTLGRELHRLIRRELNDPDPYYDIKKKYNQLMLDNYPAFQEMVNQAADPFNAALRLAVAGNVIDFGPQQRLDIMATIERVMHAQFAKDDSKQLKKDLKSANTVLYIGDNCGEIVLDKLFLETIAHSNLYFAVRGAPVINDATIEDAKMVGIDKIATIITTGDDSPGVVWENSSEEFRSIFQKADVVIAKGQGNLEGLIDIVKNSYFLLVVKCEIIGNRLGTSMGEFVVKKSQVSTIKTGKLKTKTIINSKLKIGK